MKWTRNKVLGDGWGCWFPTTVCWNVSSDTTVLNENLQKQGQNQSTVKASAA